LNLSRQIQLVKMDLRSAVGGQFDLVCANLPYIPSLTLSGLPVAAAEPVLALDGGSDGLGLIKRLLLDSHRWLAPGGCLLLEIEAGQGDSAPDLARQILPGIQCTVVADYAGLPRVLRIDKLPKG
jgi:release factor glutamine methyltransferase